MAKSLEWDQLYPNRFLHAEEFRGKDVTLTIASVDLEELEGSRGKQIKVIICFKETRKQWVAPKSCGIPLKKMWGKNAANWVGHKVTLYPAEVDSFGERVLAIRVRGSPELAEALAWEEQLGRQKSRFKLQATGKPNGKPAPAPEPPPDADPLDGSDVDDDATLAAEAREREAAEAANR